MLFRLWSMTRSFAFMLMLLLATYAGLKKEYRLPCMETVILQATVVRDTLPTNVVASAKELHK